jgi:hypothetical protein
MGIFSSKKEGSMMDIIRCDEQDYLIWKWRASGNEVSPTNKENASRCGSSLRVKDGEVAVFVYKQKDGVIQDFIEGPFDETIKLPVTGSEEEQIKIVTQSMADNFAKRIKDSPVDWHMLQRIWVDEEN